MTLSCQRLAAVWCACLLAVGAGTVAADTLTTVNMRRAIQSPADGERQYPAVITAVAMHPQGKFVAAAGDDHVIRIWNMEDGELSFRLAGHTDWIRALAFSPDGQSLVSSGNDRRVLLWDMETGQLARPLAQHDHAVGVVAFNHQGTWVATAGFGGQICLLELTPGAEEQDLRNRLCRHPCSGHLAGRSLHRGGRPGRIGACVGS